MTVANENDISFEDTTGAKVTIPARYRALYSTVKSHQLSVLNALISAHVSGFTVTIDDDVMVALTGIAADLSVACYEIMGQFASIACPIGEQDLTKQGDA